MNTPEPNEIYRHFKGNLYRIITIAQDADTGERVVVYQALYGDNAVFVRKLTDFMARLDKNRYPMATQIHRFEPMENPMNRSAYKKAESKTVVHETMENPMNMSAYEKAEGKTVVHKPLENPMNMSAYEKAESKTAVHEPARTNTNEEAAWIKKKEAHRSPETREGRRIPETREACIITETKEAYKNPDTREAYKNPDTREAHKIPETREVHKTPDTKEELPLDPLLIDFLDISGHQERLDILSRLRSKLTPEMINIMAAALETELMTPAENTEGAYAELRSYLLTMEKYERKHR